VAEAGDLSRPVAGVYEQLITENLQERIDGLEAAAGRPSTHRSVKRPRHMYWLGMSARLWDGD
jgi:hypothetical protein